MEEQHSGLQRSRLLTPSATGYSLVELLVTLVIVAVIAAISFPAYRFLYPRARAIECASHLRALGTALNQYQIDHDDRMPVMAAARSSIDDSSQRTVDMVLQPYIDDPQCFGCPADRTGLFQDTGTSYYWNSLLNGQKATSLRFLFTTNPAEIPVLSDKEAFHEGFGGGVNILFADGHVQKDIQFQVSP